MSRNPGPVIVKPTPTITQVEMVELLNRACGTNYPVPRSETDAGFLIDGLLDLERQQKRVSQRQESDMG